ncbi:MAG: hypothetical protein LBB23_00335 [Rickettsiales bacterium]|jgi:hypothetical protein|nr:hypothetical protein [Rickettsiales bacterium]
MKKFKSRTFLLNPPPLSPCYRLYFSFIIIFGLFFSIPALAEGDAAPTPAAAAPAETQSQLSKDVNRVFAKELAEDAAREAAKADTKKRKDDCFLEKGDSKEVCDNFARNRAKDTEEGQNSGSAAPAPMARFAGATATQKAIDDFTKNFDAALANLDSVDKIAGVEKMLDQFPTTMAALGIEIMFDGEEEAQGLMNIDAAQVKDWLEKHPRAKKFLESDRGQSLMKKYAEKYKVDPAALANIKSEVGLKNANAGKTADAAAGATAGASSSPTKQVGARSSSKTSSGGGGMSLGQGMTKLDAGIAGLGGKTGTFVTPM